MSKKAVSRMRVFAGPNGSGKSTIIKEIQKKVRTGIYINADDIEKACKDKKFINLGDYGLESTDIHFNTYLAQSTFLAKVQQENLNIDISFANNIIKIGQDTNSYEAALIADYLRKLLLEKGQTFSFETVMSHPSKLDMLKQSHALGFKNYLYFVSTESADINVRRVAARVEKGGHPVDEQKIRDRYPEIGSIGHFTPKNPVSPIQSYSRCGQSATAPLLVARMPNPCPTLP
jgi:predicted ABC-type ATPase